MKSNKISFNSNAKLRNKITVDDIGKLSINDVKKLKKILECKSKRKNTNKTNKTNITEETEPIKNNIIQEQTPPLFNQFIDYSRFANKSAFDNLYNTVNTLQANVTDFMNQPIRPLPVKSTIFGDDAGNFGTTSKGSDSFVSLDDANDDVLTFDTIDTMDYVNNDNINDNSIKFDNIYPSNDKIISSKAPNDKFFVNDAEVQTDALNNNLNIPSKDDIIKNKIDNFMKTQNYNKYLKDKLSAVELKELYIHLGGRDENIINLNTDRGNKNKKKIKDALEYIIPIYIIPVKRRNQDK